jgi:hypothetical protein
MQIDSDYCIGKNRNQCTVHTMQGSKLRTT